MNQKNQNTLHSAPTDGEKKQQVLRRVNVTQKIMIGVLVAVALAALVYKVITILG